MSNKNNNNNNCAYSSYLDCPQKGITSRTATRLDLYYSRYCTLSSN